VAKKFFYVCAGLFLLAGAYAMGARSAGAQAGSQIVGFAVASLNGNHHYVITSTGDVWYHFTDGSSTPYNTAPLFIGNFWSGTGPVNVQPQSFGQLKARYR